MIYLDWAASAVPYADEIEAAYRETSAVFANPSAQHRFGKKARELLENARSRCAAVLGVPSDTLYFTSGASESNALALLSLLTRPNSGSLLISSIEHPSVREQATVLERCGWTVLSIPSDKNGRISPDAVLKTIREDTALIAIMAVNNEIGSIQPIRAIAEAIRTHTAGKRYVHFHVDMTQSIGKLPVSDLALADVSSASMSAHKIGGPRGIGLLYLKRPFSSGIRGGAQERTIRPGTENLTGACALARCIEKTYANFQEKLKRAGELSRFITESLRHIPEASLIPAGRSLSERERGGEGTDFSPWIIQVSFKKLPAEVMMRCLSDRGIFVSAGSACSSKKKIRPILEVLSIAPEFAQNALRISIGPATTKSELEFFIAAVKEILKEFE